MSSTAFLSTLSLRRATLKFPFCVQSILISIHALLAESDESVTTGKIPVSNFYPRSPCGERPEQSAPPKERISISIHALLAESDPRPKRVHKSASISIHALLAESDVLRSGPSHQRRHFYPRSPCGERRWQDTPNYSTTLFLSTLSLRRATYCYLWALAYCTNFYPRSPCGERPRSIGCLGRPHHFYPRSPCGERQATLLTGADNYTISIHALLAESDVKRLLPSWELYHFYPRSPCGERQHEGTNAGANSSISIHALLAESDLSFAIMPLRSRLFLSTLSLRRATLAVIVGKGPPINFYPRSPCGERPC